jgi:TadE-like protein
MFRGDTRISYGRGSLRGQSLVEFALVLPMLMVLLLGIADFGRIMSQGIVLEAAVRNGAEAAAQELVQRERNTPGGLTANDYDEIHLVALQTVCEDAKTLPNQVESGGICDMPWVAVCVHEAAAGLIDGKCGSEKLGAPAECTVMNDAWSPAVAQTNPAQPLSYVEVRACYRFTTLFNLNLRLPFGSNLALGDVWLQRDRSFVAGNY